MDDSALTDRSLRVNCRDFSITGDALRVTVSGFPFISRDSAIPGLSAPEAQMLAQELGQPAGITGKSTRNRSAIVTSDAKVSINIKISKVADLQCRPNTVG